MRWTLLLHGVTLWLGSEAARAQSAPPVRIAVEMAADPWARPDGSGFANEVVRRAFAAVGGSVDVMVVPYARCRRMVLSGDVVACLLMSAAPDLAGRVDFPPVPLVRCRTLLLRARLARGSVRRLADLSKGASVGVVRGYEYPPAVGAAAHVGDIRLEYSDSEEMMLRKLAAGRLSAAIVNVDESRSLAFIRARAGVADVVEPVAQLGVLESHIGFSRVHPQGARALADFTRGWRLLEQRGVVRQLEREWRDSADAVVRAAQASTVAHP